jgi:hypothetical protein
MKDNMNPKRMTRSQNGGGAMPTPARTKANGWWSE